jgi:CCR4-NOT transcriptional regulation complex NOT5 subunit
MESIRNEPVKYSSLICYNGIYGLQQQQQYTSSQNYYVEHYTTMLIEEAERLYNKLVKEITNGITYDPAFSSSTSSSSPSVLSSSSSSDGTTTKSSFIAPPKSNISIIT